MHLVNHRVCAGDTIACTQIPGFGDPLTKVKADLAQLGTSYADLILLHAPQNVDEQWKGLEQALAQNLTRSSEFGYSL